MRHEPDVIWLHFTADLLIALAYFSIPFALVYFVRRRRDLALGWMVLLFALFIVLCGITHLFGVWALWRPLYRLDGYIKLATGVVSAATAVLLWRLIPRALAIPSAEALQRMNEEVQRLNADLERRVYERTAELESVFAGAPVGLCVLDRELRWVRINRRLAEINGFPPAAHIGKTVRELLPDIADRVEPSLRRVLDTGEPLLDVPLEGETPARPGERRWWVENFFPLHDDAGRVVGINIVCEEVTERRRAEEALREASRRKDEFLATLAHELRNPLAPIRNGLELLRLAPHGEHAARARDVMERQVAHMVRLIDDLLDVSRISRGMISLKLQRVALRTVIDAALEASRPFIEAARHELVVRLPEAPLDLDADPTRLAQVISNILNNAAKYTPDGGRITLTAEQEGDQVALRVTDTGVGIPPEMLPRVFEMFTQVGRTIDRAQGGLGIGLSLVKQLIEMHGGTVAAESDGPGRGSTFTVRVPLADCAHSPAVAGPDAAPPRAGARRILVVDDNIDGAESLALMLELAGHATRVAHSGVEGLAAAREFRPDVVLLDIGLPGLNGYEVARRLRRDPELAGTLLVALTGWGSEEDKRQAIDAGFDVHLTKPVEAAALDAALAHPRPAAALAAPPA